MMPLSTAVTVLLEGVDVGSVDGKGGHRLGQRVAQFLAGVVAVGAPPFTDLGQLIGEPLEVACKFRVCDLELLGAPLIVELGHVAGEGLVDACERAETRGVYEETADQVEPVVAGRALHRPFG